jgi:4-hydroxythreonine-4-phosphate dehydrogenase
MQPWPAELVVVADLALLQQRAAQLGLDVSFEIAARERAASPHQAGRLSVLPLDLAVPAVAGELNPANAAYVLATLQRAVEGCQAGLFDAMVTAPVQKSVINEAGQPFSGHTEFLARATGTEHVVMLLATPKMRVALATTHLPLAAVPAAITAESLTRTVQILHHDLVDRFGLEDPCIAVLGLNPHAGEGGHLGREEIDTIIPVLEHLRTLGLRLTGPLPADTAFNPRILEHCDAILAMYHDQGLPVLKYSGFGSAVNITLGLPILRTSVDHGTALDMAGTGGASSGSLETALAMAIDLCGCGLRDIP